jgi:phosphatidylserine/phosphatidylglycerophosphate/cardiolipin synthase-like enzyme
MFSPAIKFILQPALSEAIKEYIFNHFYPRCKRHSSSDFVANSGIPTFIDARHAIAHNKIIVVDRNVLITGSFNFTKAAEEKNAENLLIMKGNKPLIDAYIRNFAEHKGHSDVYMGRMSR